MTVQKSNRKVVETGGKIDSLTHIYMAANVPGLIQALQ